MVQDKTKRKSNLRELLKMSKGNEDTENSFAPEIGGENFQNEDSSVKQEESEKQEQHIDSKPTKYEAKSKPKAATVKERSVKDLIARRSQTEKLVHITIEVPESWRRHFKAEGARKGKTFVDVAVSAFIEEFGLPKE